MFSYLKRSIKKFREDAFSKLIYDILKWLIRITIMFGVAGFIPYWERFNALIETTVTFTIYQCVLISVFIVMLTIVVFYSLFNLKYRIIQNAYYTDELTGLKNHLAMKKYLETQIIELRTNNLICSFILIDIDNFKLVNEAIGYNAADQVLVKIGTVLGNDKRITDEVFRYFQRGDEFLIVLNETSLDGAIKTANRKKQLISKINFELGETTQKVTVCCGITEFNKANDDLNTITGRLGKALLEAKKQPNKNCVRSIV